MPVLARLFRNTPGSNLRDYFAVREIPLPEPVNWNGGNASILRPLLRAVDKLTEVERARCHADAERIDRMTSEVGQTAILAVATKSQQDQLRYIETKHARALWMFLKDSERFGQAEAAAFFDNARRGRTWDRFVAPVGLQVSTDPGQLAALAREVQRFFQEGEKVKVEVFDRTRPDPRGMPHQLIQVSIHREGMPNNELVFDGDELERLVYRPVYELAFTYEPALGIIEVVAQNKLRRADLAKLFARTLLGYNIDADRIGPHHYDLSVFMTECAFDTDPQDGIESVRLCQVRFATHDGRAFVTVEARTENESVYAVGQRLFGRRNPFIAGGYHIHEVLLAVRFHPDRDNPRGKTINIKLRQPNGCDLKDKTDKERKIGEKYLSRWGILRSVAFA